jgi:hypothetical protein
LKKIANDIACFIEVESSLGIFVFWVPGTHDLIDSGMMAMLITPIMSNELCHLVAVVKNAARDRSRNYSKGAPAFTIEVAMPRL